MNHQSRTLTVLVAREDFARIVQSLSPSALNMAALRLVGLTDGQIAELLGCTRSNVANSLRCARNRVTQAHPDLAHHLQDRRRSPPRTHRRRPLDWSWLEPNLQGESDHE